MPFMPLIVGMNWGQIVATAQRRRYTADFPAFRENLRILAFSP